MQDVESSESSSFNIDCNANNYVNDPNIELKWAMKAYQHAEVYFNLLCALDPTLLKLTKMDSDIHKHFRETFKNLAVDKIDEDVLKSSEAKEIWRPFCESYKDKVEDYNMATLLRIDSTSDYSEENTTIVPRIQFYAIEIARNKEGHNVAVRDKFKKAAQNIEHS